MFSCGVSSPGSDRRELPQPRQPDRVATVHMWAVQLGLARHLEQGDVREGRVTGRPYWGDLASA